MVRNSPGNRSCASRRRGNACASATPLIEPDSTGLRPERHHDSRTAHRGTRGRWDHCLQRAPRAVSIARVAVAGRRAHHLRQGREVPPAGGAEWHPTLEDPSRRVRCPSDRHRLFESRDTGLAPQDIVRRNKQSALRRIRVVDHGGLFGDTITAAFSMPPAGCRVAFGAMRFPYRTPCGLCACRSSAERRSPIRPWRRSL